MKKFYKTDKNQSKKKAIIQSLENDATITDACRGAGISRETFYNWQKEDKNFRQEIENTDNAKVETVESAIFKRAKGYDVTEGKINKKGEPFETIKHIPGDVTAQIFILCNLKPERWKSIIKVDHTGKVGLGIEFKEITSPKQE